MKYLGFLVVCGAILAGCGKSSQTVVGSNGESVTTTNDGTKTTYSDNQGHTATVDSSGNQFNVKDDKGNSMTAGGTVSEQDLGLPFYPGSEEKKGASLDLNADGNHTVSATRTTKDDPDKVAAFYKDKLQDPKSTDMNSDGSKMSILSGKLQDGAEVSITAHKQGSEDTEVSVSVTHSKDKK